MGPRGMREKNQERVPKGAQERTDRRIDLPTIPAKRGSKGEKLQKGRTI